ncbi:uncharacterized protein [Paramisgurnus dabryanus]|uniref:uncharacterized protein isoform X1 n=1 Tax=Paramisgurnus dabryanus TaxID=90735 RepID=UPI003CCF79BF
MDRDTVQLNCSNSENQKMNECYFIIDGRENKQSRSCQLSLTGSNIIKWSVGQRSSVIITCYYTVYISQVLMSSPRSDPVTVQIPTSSTTATTTTTVITTINFPAEAVTSRTKTTAVSTSTTTVGTTTTVMTTLSTTGTKTSAVPLTPVISGTTPEAKDTKMWVIIQWSALACSVIVLTGLICLCGFACKKRSKRQRTAGDSRASGPADIYSLITSVPDTSKPTDSKPGLSDTYSLITNFQPSGLKKPQSHQESEPVIYSLISLTSQPSDLKQPQPHQETKPETYSLITSTSQPSDVLNNTRHKKGHTEKDENVYHVYCTIPDKPVRAVAGDQIYSLAI